MALLFLRLRLAIFLLYFTSDILGFYLKKIHSLLLGIAFLLLVLCSAMITIITTQNSVRQDEIISVALKNQSSEKSATEVLFTRKEVDAKIQQYEKILQIQPQHRDVLVNTSLLYQAITEQKKAHQLWEQARELDPNNPLFSTN